MIQNTETCAVPGFMANGIHAVIKENGDKDLALVYSIVPAKASGVFTSNCFKAAPVLLDEIRIRIKSGVAQAVLVNSGNANAATGQEGYQDVIAMSGSIAGKLNIDDKLVLVASTGVIGRKLPVKKITSSMQRLVKGLDLYTLPGLNEVAFGADEENINPIKDFPLPMTEPPISCTAVKINDFILLDPCFDEEKEARIVPMKMLI